MDVLHTILQFWRTIAHVPSKIQSYCLCPIHVPHPKFFENLVKYDAKWLCDYDSVNIDLKDLSVLDAEP